MKKIIINSKTDLKVNKSTEGEPLERKIERIRENNDSIEDIAEPVYTERKDGVVPITDIRTDRMEMALEINDKLHSSEIARRKGLLEQLPEVAKGESIEGQAEGSEKAPETT